MKVFNQEMHGKRGTIPSIISVLKRGIHVINSTQPR